jgi:hypothetical protein
MTFDGLLHLVIANQGERARQQQANRILQRHLRDTSNPFTLLDERFLTLFRLSKFCCNELIEILTPLMTESRRTTKVPAHLRILCSLFFFGQGSYQVGIGHGYLVAQSQPSISRCISEVSKLVTRPLLHQWLKFPSNNERRHQIKEQFQQRGIFEDVLGIIDYSYKNNSTS